MNIANTTLQLSHTQQVMALLCEHELTPLLPTDNLEPLIAAHAALGYTPHTTALLLCYTSALELQNKGVQALAQQLFNRARQLHDELSRAQQTAAFDSIEFVQCIAASREIAQRLCVAVVDNE
jgi:hypothetical protein